MRKRTNNQTDMWATLVLLVLIVIIMSAVFLAANTEKANADEIVFEPGATFDGGVCWESDGTEGITTFDGQCMTPADYDKVFGYEALSETPALGPVDVSIAELYGLVDDGVAASERPRSFAGVAYPSFVDVIAIIHGRPVA